MKKCLAVLALALLPALLPSIPQAQTSASVLQQVVINLSRERVPNTGTAPLVVRYILIDPGNALLERDGFEPLERVAVLLLFIGGDGTLGLTANQLNTGSPNFLARNRNHFAAEGFVIALVDAASDFNVHGGRLEMTSPAGKAARRQASLRHSRGHERPARPLFRRPTAWCSLLRSPVRTRRRI